MIFREVHEVYHKKTRTAKAVRVNGALFCSFLSLKDEPDTGRTQGTCRESGAGQQSPGKITQCEAVGADGYPGCHKGVQDSFHRNMLPVNLKLPALIAGDGKQKKRTVPGGEAALKAGIGAPDQSGGIYLQGCCKVCQLCLIFIEKESICQSQCISHGP